MHRFECKERVVLENGVLCRIVTACGTGKFKGRSMDVAKIYEDGRQLCRNIDLRPVAGWCIDWPGETGRACYGGGYYGKPYVSVLEPYSKPYGDISGCSWGRPDSESKKAFVKKYPEFKWILKKSELSNREYFHLLPYWKKYPREIERRTHNPLVPGSSPGGPTSGPEFARIRGFSFYFVAPDSILF